MGLILLGLLLVIAGVLVNALDLASGGILRTVGWILIVVGVVLALLDILRGGVRSRIGPDEPQVTLIVWGIGLIVLGLVVDLFTRAGGGILGTIGILLIVVGVLMAFVDIAREPSHRTWRY